MKKCLFIVFIFCLKSASAQDLQFAKKVVDTLTSPYFWGRGYTNDGMGKASVYLANQFKLLGLQPLRGKEFFQHFSYPVNTFPATMELSINGKALVPGKDYIVSPESCGVVGKGSLKQQDSTHFIDVANRIMVSLEDKLTWSVAGEAQDYTVVLIQKKAIEEKPVSIVANIQNKLIRDFKTTNVCASIKGTRFPDSVIVVSAHYDHLGGMGKETYFPGANDNASGISLLLGLAKYYSAHPPAYTIAFICFAGEEAGLKGSKYFTENPLIPLKSIKFLLNLDLTGTGDEGITIVNASEFPKAFLLLNKVNDEGKFLSKINARGKAANSDHYWFTEKGVPAFFLYTLGGIAAYHDVYDKAETLPLNEYEDLLKLIVNFNKQLMK